MAKRSTVQSSSKAGPRRRQSSAKATGAKLAGAKTSGKKSAGKPEPPRKRTASAPTGKSGASRKAKASSSKVRADASEAKKAAPGARRATRAGRKKATAPRTETASSKATSKKSRSVTTAKPARPPARKVARKAPRASGAASAPPAPSGITIAGVEIVDPSKRLPKTKLRKKQLTEFKELLLAKRRELLGDVSQLSNEALHTSRQGSRGDLSNMPSHMADIGSDNWEQEFTLGLIATERELLRQIDAALQRIRDRTYGVCLATHRMISQERLRAKPWAQYCIEFARLRDAGRIPPSLFWNASRSGDE